MVASFNGSFDIRNFTSNLTQSHKGKDYYVCPGCGGSSLHINPDTGAYKCWSTECESAVIREAVAPTGKPGTKPTNKPVTKPATPKPRMKPVVAPVALRPFKPKTSDIAGEYKGNTFQIPYTYSDAQYVIRSEFQKNGKREKTFTPHHIDSNGVAVAKKGDKLWPLYGTSDIEKWGGGCWINEAEGEKCADHLASIGIVACSATGTANENDIRYGYQRAIDAGIVGIIYHQDNDKAGENKAKKHQKIANDMGIPFIIVPAKELYPDIKEKGDIADLIAGAKVIDTSLISFLDNKIKEAANKPDDQPLLTLAVDNTKPSDDPVVTFNQTSLKELFDDTHSCVNEKFYQWQGKYHKELDPALVLKRIRDFCNSYAIYVENKEGKVEIKYPFANTKTVNEVFKWAQISLAVSNEEFNKTVGINCTNGVVVIDWEHNKPIVKLEPHDPTKHFFTSEPIITYNPNADTKYCDQLLRCLDDKQLQVLLRNLGASLDLPTVRKFKGRLIKILFCIGGGSNGKDSIREVISLIYGSRTVSNFSLNDFTDYDNGNKNSLAGLSKARVNWASESGKTTRIDNSLSLKRFATGDTLTERYLFKDGIDYVPNAIALFNLNELPNLFGTGQAALDRFAPLMFNKSFVKQEDYDPANPNQELADPRFKYDQEFLINQVCPAFLNYMIQGLQDLMVEGIDYSCTKEALENIQIDNNHLFEAAQDLNWHYDPNAKPIRIGELHKQLIQWYKNQEIYDESKGYAAWSEPHKPSDKYIKNARLLLPRLKEVFPKLQITELRVGNSSQYADHIVGISTTAVTKPASLQSLQPIANSRQMILCEAPLHVPPGAMATTPTSTPNLPQIYPKSTPNLPQNENTSKPDISTVSAIPSTPSTPNCSKPLEKNSKEEIDHKNSAKTSQTISKNSADDDGTVKNIERLDDFGVDGVDKNAENLATQEIYPNQFGVDFGVDLGSKPADFGVDPAPVPTTPPIAIDDLISRIEVVDPQEVKKREFKQQQQMEQQIIEEIKAQILNLQSTQDHLDLKRTLEFNDGKVFRAIRAWLQSSIVVMEDATKEFTILSQEFVDIWLS